MNFGPQIVRSGLVLYLDAANKKSYRGTGTSWLDLSGNNSVGTLTNFGVQTFFSATNGGNIIFDGTDDTVSINASSVFNFTSMTFLSFVNVTSPYTSAFRAVFSKQGADRDYNFYVYSSLSNGVIDYLHFSSARITGFTSIAAIPGGSLSLSTWHQIGFSVNNQVLSFILDGVVFFTSSYTGTFNANNNYSLNVGSADNFWLGRIANVSLYNRGLSNAEILQNFNATKTRFGL
jgi:hypothetical protein